MSPSSSPGGVHTRSGLARTATLRCQYFRERRWPLPRTLRIRQTRSSLPLCLRRSNPCRRGDAPIVSSLHSSHPAATTCVAAAWWLTAACAVLLLCGLASAFRFTGTFGSITHNGLQSQPQSSSTRSIESLRVGQRVLAENPDSKATESTGDTAVDPATWRCVRLQARERWLDGTEDVLEVETLQPPEWLREHDVSVGRQVPPPVDLVEMGLPKDLRATVISVDPCPPIEHGQGRVVLSTVSHLADNVYELVFEDGQGRRETLRPTGTHPFYEEDRRDWVSAEQLQPGQRVRGRQGTLRTVSGATHSRRAAGVQYHG